MYDVVIVHGSFGNPYENWFPWLYKKLSQMGKKVLVPDLPTPEGQSLERWMSILSSYNSNIGKETIIIAHSLSPAFVADYLLINKKHIKGLIAVAPFYGLINIEEFDQVNASFFVDEMPLEKLDKYVGNIHCLYADNDPYVPIKLSEDFVSRTKSKKTIISGGGHLNTGAGYTEFNELLNIYNKMQ